MLVFYYKISGNRDITINFEKIFDFNFKWHTSRYSYSQLCSSTFSDIIPFSKNTKILKKRFQRLKNKRKSKLLIRTKVNSIYRRSSIFSYKKSLTWDIKKLKENSFFYEVSVPNNYNNIQLLPSRDDFIFNFKKNKTMSKYYFNLKIYALDVFDVLYNDDRYGPMYHVKLPEDLVEAFSEEDPKLLSLDYSYFLKNLKKKLKDKNFIHDKLIYNLSRTTKLNYYLDNMFELLKPSVNKILLFNKKYREYSYSQKQFLKQKRRQFIVRKKKSVIKKYWSVASMDVDFINKHLKRHLNLIGPKQLITKPQKKLVKRERRRSKRGPYYRWFGDPDAPHLADLHNILVKRKKKMGKWSVSFKKKLKEISISKLNMEVKFTDFFINLISSKSYLQSRVRLTKRVHHVSIKTKKRRNRRRTRTFRKIRIFRRKKGKKLSIHTDMHKHKNLFFLDNNLFYKSTMFSSKFNNIFKCIFFLKKIEYFNNVNVNTNIWQNDRLRIPIKMIYNLLKRFQHKYMIIISIDPLKWDVYRNNDPLYVRIYTNSFITILRRLFQFKKIDIFNKKVESTFDFSNFALINFLPDIFLKKYWRKSVNQFDSKLYKSNIIFPNLNFIKFFSKLFRKRKFRKQKFSLKKSQNLYLSHLNSILTSIFYVKTSIAFVNLRKKFIKIGVKKLVDFFAKENIKFHYKIGTGFFLKEAIQVSILSLMTRDSTLFINWFTKIMERVGIRKHKIYLYFFKTLFTFFRKRGTFKLLKLSGLYLDVRGKVGVKGDAKKRHSLIKIGYCTFSRKSISITPSYGLVNTNTGVLGVTFILFYNK